MSIIYIQIDNRIIKNPKLSCEAFALYVEIKYLCFINRNNFISIYHNKLLKFMKWKDKRKLKKYLIELYNLKLIKEEIKSLPKQKKITITLTKYESKNYTQLPNNLIKNLHIIGEIGLRLLYYYKSFINSESEEECAYPSIETIKNDLGISEHTIIKYNKDILEKKKLIKIEEHKLEGKIKNINTNKYFTKYNNYYYIRFDKILKL